MKKSLLHALLLGIACPACSNSSAPVDVPADAVPATPAVVDPPVPTPAEPPADSLHPLFPPGVAPVRAMYDAVDALQARAEHGASEVVVQHCLIGVGPKFGTRGPADGERDAAGVLQELAAGASFDELVKRHTNDAHPGIYTMLVQGTPDYANKIYLRQEMAPAFGDVAWRLRVGEVGVAPYDPAPPSGQNTSPFGLHIIKRLR